jgi:glucokinase
LILIFLFDDKGEVEANEQRVKSMLDSLLAEALAVTVDNLSMTATILACAEEAMAELSPEAQQRLNLVHVALSMALQAMEHEELEQIMEQSDNYIPSWMSLI